MEMTLEQKRAIALARARLAAGVAPAEDYVQPAPPPGVIIHGADGSYLSDKPEIAAKRPEGGDSREMAVTMQALKERGATGDGMGPVARGLMPVAQGLSFNFGDELVSGAKGAIDAARGGSFADGYDVAQEVQKQELARERKENPYRAMAGEVAGGAATAVGATAGLGLTAARLMPTAAGGAQGFGATLGAGLVDGAVAGGLSGAGEGSGYDRIRNALIGSAAGAGFGLGTPIAMSVGNAVAAPVLNPLLSRWNPQAYADRAVETALRRSGMTADDVANELRRAQADGQSVYTAADAIGNPAQRMISTAARTPSDGRAALIEALTRRQEGQGRRLTTAMSEGFDAPDTAAARSAGLTGARAKDANINYGLARAMGGTVDVSPAVSAADGFLTPGATRLMQPGTNIADDSVEAAVRKARSYLTDGRSMVSEFDTAFRAKMELDAMIERAAPTVQRQLIPIRNALDAQLEAASGPYSAARDAFRTASKEIDAVDTGKNAAMRGRTEDTIPAFNAMTDGEKAAFRAGYVDPYIADIQKAAPGVNRARALQSDATAAEFPAFAAPGRAGQLTDRIGREQRMFETYAGATGGSKTADNLADAADMEAFDPSMIGNIISGNFGTAAKNATVRAMTNMTGQTPAVRDRIVQALMSSSPDVAQQSMTRARQRVVTEDDRRQAIIRALLGAGVAGVSY